MAESLRKFDGERYEVGCFTVMPNHVHVVVRPFDADEKALERVTHSWKRYTSREINRLFDLKGSLWQDESYDRIIRDEEHLWNTLQYIGSNSRKAELSNKICPTWISPSWVDCGWRFVDEDEAIGIVK